MVNFKNRSTLEIGRNARLFLNVEAGMTGIGALINQIKTRLGIEPAAQPLASKPQAPATSPQIENGAPAQARQQAEQSQMLKRIRQQLANKERELANLRAKLDESNSDALDIGIRPENIIWVFGCGRTGSSWLTTMMADVEGYARWNEPYVGDVFGYAYYLRASEWMRGRKDFILGDPYYEIWLRSIRGFVLDGVNARYAEMDKDGFLVIKEPNGSTGAPLLMKALPESRMIFLVRDPRDTVASMLASQRKGSWGSGQRAYSNGDFSLADENPDEFVRQHAHLYMASLMKAREAYDTHKGHKVMVRYEDLRYETFDELKKIYSSLGVPLAETRLQRLAEKHAWENVPEDQKGADKPRRKAKPGGYREDLTPKQIEVVEEITSSVIKEFYSE